MTHHFHHFPHSHHTKSQFFLPHSETLHFAWWDIFWLGLHDNESHVSDKATPRKPSVKHSNHHTKKAEPCQNFCLWREIPIRRCQQHLMQPHFGAVVTEPPTPAITMILVFFRFFEWALDVDVSSTEHYRWYNNMITAIWSKIIRKCVFASHSPSFGWCEKVQKTIPLRRPENWRWTAFRPTVFQHVRTPHPKVGWNLHAGSCTDGIDLDVQQKNTTTSRCLVDMCKKLANHCISSPHFQIFISIDAPDVTCI